MMTTQKAATKALIFFFCFLSAASMFHCPDAKGGGSLDKNAKFIVWNNPALEKDKADSNTTEWVFLLDYHPLYTKDYNPLKQLFLRLNNMKELTCENEKAVLDQFILANLVSNILKENPLENKNELEGLLEKQGYITFYLLTELYEKAETPTLLDLSKFYNLLREQQKAQGADVSQLPEDYNALNDELKKRMETLYTLNEMEQMKQSLMNDLIEKFITKENKDDIDLYLKEKIDINERKPLPDDLSKKVLYTIEKQEFKAEDVDKELYIYLKSKISGSQASQEELQSYEGLIQENKSKLLDEWYFNQLVYEDSKSKEYMKTDEAKSFISFFKYLQLAQFYIINEVLKDMSIDDMEKIAWCTDNKLKLKEAYEKKNNVTLTPEDTDKLCSNYYTQLKQEERKVKFVKELKQGYSIIRSKKYSKDCDEWDNTDTTDSEEKETSGSN